jgi:hypothetical protein
MINIVDRIGKTHKAGEFVYAYFDTQTEEYIVLDKYSEITTPTIFGIYNPSTGILTVEYAAGIDYYKDGIVKGTEVTVVNKLNLSTPQSCTIFAVAIKMERL